MATKLSFRARALDATKPLPIYRSEDEPDILKEAAINRGVMEMATGMEKEEEEEIHIRQVIHQENPLVNAVVIPVPEASSNAKVAGRDEVKFLLPKQFIRTHVGWEIEEDVPTYDMDSEDEEWVGKFNAERKKISKDAVTLTVDKFELIFGQIEGMLIHGSVDPRDLVGIAGEEHPLYVAILEYAQHRIRELERPTVTPMTKPDTQDGNSIRDAYVAFRARTEKMQTRKSQKNQEASYVNMLKLHRDLIRCRDIIEMVRKREAKKVELLRIRKEIIDTRFAMKDWTGALLAKCTPQPVLKMQLPMRLPSGMLDGAAAFDSEHRNGPSSHPAYHPAMSPDSARRRMGGNKGKRKAREDDSPSIFGRPSKYALHEGYDEESDDDEEASSESSAVTEDEYDRDEPFRLRRRFNMFYHAPLTELPHRASSSGQYQLARRITDGSRQPRPALRGYCRRRIGRGGRIFIDRCRPDFDYQDELSRVTMEQEDDLRVQQAKLQDYYAQRQREQQQKRQLEQDAGGTPGAAEAGAADAAAASDSDTAGSRSSRRSANEKAHNPYAKSYVSASRDRLPPAGADFGSGGESVKSGPFVRLVGRPVEGQGQGGWMPVSVAAATKQAVGPEVRLAPSPTKAFKGPAQPEAHDSSSDTAI